MCKNFIKQYKRYKIPFIRAKFLTHMVQLTRTVFRQFSPSEVAAHPVSNFLLKSMIKFELEMRPLQPKINTVSMSELRLGALRDLNYFPYLVLRPQNQRSNKIGVPIIDFPEICIS